MGPDIEKYMSQLDEFDMTEEQKIQFIENLWNFLEHFADLAFNGSDQEILELKKLLRD